MMESMHYVNIFETKGLEYLLVISFLIGFVALVRRLSYSKAAKAGSEASPSVTMADDIEILCPAGADCPYEQLRATAREDGVQESAVDQSEPALARISAAGVDTS